MTEFLEFVDAHQVIQHNVSSSNKISFKNFPETIKSLISKGMYSVHTYKIHPDTIFINDEGVFDLFMKSRKPIAKLMKRWLIYEVIPSIIRTGTYSVSAISVALSTAQSLVIAEPCPRMTICHNPKGFPVSSVKSAIYILNLPLLNMYKFGYSNNLVNRFKNHEYDFGEIIIELIREAPEVQEIEKRLKTDIRVDGINTVFEIDGRKLQEIFEPKYLEIVGEIIDNILNKYETGIFTSAENHEFRMKQEDTKYQEVIMEQKKYEVEQQEKILQQKQCEVELLHLCIKLFELEGKRKFDEMM